MMMRCARGETEELLPSRFNYPDADAAAAAAVVAKFTYTSISPTRYIYRYIYIIPSCRQLVFYWINRSEGAKLRITAFRKMLDRLVRKLSSIKNKTHPLLMYNTSYTLSLLLLCAQKIDARRYVIAALPAADQSCSIGWNFFFPPGSACIRRWSRTVLKRTLFPFTWRAKADLSSAIWCSACACVCVCITRARLQPGFPSCLL